MQMKSKKKRVLEKLGDRQKDYGDGAQIYVWMLSLSCWIVWVCWLRMLFQVTSQK